MSAFDEYRKKLQGKYGSDSKYIPGGTAGRGKGRDTSADTEQRKRFDEYRNELKSKYNSKNYMANSEQGIQGWKKYLEDKTKAEQEATAKEESKSWWMKAIERFSYAQETTQPMGNIPSVIEDLREDQSYRRPSDDWSEEEQRTFGYKYMIDPEEAYDYAQEINISKAQAKEDDAIKEIQDSATDSVFSGALHTAGSTLTQPFGLVDYMSDLMHSAAGRPIMPDGEVTPFEYSQAVTSGISTHLNEEYGTIDEDILIIGGKGWGDAYGLAKSTGESFGYGAAFGKYGTLINYFGISAAAGVDEAKKNGATDDQALTYGALLGTFEALAESIGIEKLFKIKSSSTLKGLAKNILKQAWSEGAEEGLTTALSNVADAWVLQDSGNLYKELDYYMSQGMSEEDAKWKVFWNSLEGIAYDSLGGFVSGAAHAGLQTGIQTGVEGKNLKQQFGDGSKLVSEALENSAEGSDLRNLAEKYQGKLDGGKSLSGTQLIELNEAIASNDETLIKKAALRRLGELGETNDVTPIAETLVKLAKGEKLTSKEVTILNESKAGHIVASEINKKNIQSGGLGNTWAENIGTRRISPESYNKQFYNEQLYDLAKQVAAKAAEKASVDKKLGADTSEVEKNVKVAESGKTIYRHGNDAEDVTIKRVVSTKGGLKVELDNGNTVSVKDLEFATAEEGIMYEMVARMEVSPGTANEILSTFKPANGQQATYLFNAIPLAYQYGKIGYEAGLKNINLSDKQKRLVYNRGRMDAITESKTKPGKATASNTEKGKLNESNTDKGESTKKGIIFEDGVVYDEATANDLQKASMPYIEFIDKMSNLEVHVFASKVVNGKRVAYVNGKLVSAPNGYFKNGNQIYIDINAGNGGEGAMLYTMSHEVTHYIRRWNAKGFKEIGDFLIEQYSKNGVAVDKLLEDQKAKIKKRYNEEKKTLPSEAKLADMAYEELVADAMSDMFADPKAYEKLLKLKQKNHFAWKKLGEAIKHILDKLKGALGIYKEKESQIAVARETHHVREFSSDAYEKLQDLYIKAFVEADANYEASIGSRNLNDFSEALNEDGEPLLQYRAMEADEDTYRQMLQKWGEMSTDQIDNLFATIDTAMELIKDNLEVLDYAWEADIDDRAFSPVKPNSDKLYQVSLDFSTLCRKRILQQTVQAQLQEALNKPLTREEGIAIRDALIALQEEGRQIEVACALCYVESARMKSPEQIKRFIENKEKVIKEFFAGKSGGSIKEKVKKAEADARARLGVGNATLKSLPGKVAQEIRDAKKAAKESYKPTAEEQKLIEVAKGMTVSDFTSPEGLENLAKNYPSLFDAYTSYIRNATKSKGIENDTWWRAGDSMKIGDVLIANMNKENGLRSQSWSDFQVIHILDYIASTIELATRNTKEQAYSKVPDYVELMGLTGVMINMSLIPTAQFNGSLDYDSVEGIDYKRALELRDKYHATAGTICIGVDNVQIKLLLADTTIDYVIPYHKSGMSKALRKLMHLPTWSDYEQYQSESKLSRADAEKQAKKYGVKLLDASDPNYQKGTSFSEWFDIKEAQQIAKMENANPSDKAKQKKYGVMYGGYMAMQNAANNYLKLCAERGISPKFSHEKADFTAEENYWKLLIDRKMVDNITGDVIEQQTIKPVFNQGEIMRILNDELARYPKVKEDQDYAIRKVTEKMLSGEVKGGMSAEAIAEVMKKPVDNVTNVNILASSEDMMLSDRDTDYMDAVNRGDMETAQRMVEQVARENGYDSPLLYHGTEAFGFTQIDTSQSDDGISFFAANKEDIAASYVPYGEVREISLSMDDDAINEARENAIEERKENIIDLVGEFRGLIDRYFSEWVFGQTDNSYLEGLVEDANPEAGHGDGVYDVLSEIVYDCFYDYSDDYAEYEDAAEWEENSPEAQKIFAKIAEIEGEKSALHRLESGEALGGIYKLYANLDNMFVVDGKGAAWNELHPEGLPKIERGVYKDVPYKTRDVAKWAKESGYDGVIFKNIRDNGAYGRTPAGDVYAFFKPESQVKSADPVTYDDNGNVIPLSERFNSKNNDIRYSERDYPIDSEVEKIVNDAFAKSGSSMHELGDITSEQNSAINRLVNQTKDDSYRGKYTGGKHRFSDDAIRHIMTEHGDFLREGLRAQLPMRPEDIVRHLSAIKSNKNPSKITPTRTKQGNPSVLTSYEVNGYTLYAEEITKSLGKNLPSDLIGHTMYKAPTLSTAAFYATSAQTQPKRQSTVLCDYYSTKNKHLSRGNFVSDSNGSPALLNYMSLNGSAKQDARTSGLIALSSDKSNFTDKVGSIKQGYVICKKPYYITQDHRVFSNSATNVLEKIEELKKQGYDCFIFDKVIGDNYMVAVFNKAQIIKNAPSVIRPSDTEDTEMHSERDPNAVSTRTLLANALESTAKDPDEKNLLRNYQTNARLIEKEQAKLAEVRTKANEIRFTKGRTPAETKIVRDLDTEAQLIESRINSYDKELLKLEAMQPIKNVLNREKTLLRKKLEQQGKEALKAQKEKDAKTVRELMARHTESRKKAVEAQREKDAKTVRELMARHQESRKKAIEGRNKTAMRHKIQKTLKRLNKLFKGGKERNVKEGMRDTVATALALGEILFNNEISNRDIVRLGVESVTEKESKLLNEYHDLLIKKEANDERIESIRKGEIKPTSRPYLSEVEEHNRKIEARIAPLNKELSDVFARERIRLTRTSVSTLIYNLATEYHSLQESKVAYIKNAYNADLFTKLIDLMKEMDGVTARDMSMAQLEKVDKVFTMLEHSIRTANQYFRNGKFEDLQTSASAIMEEIEKLKDTKQISPELAAKAKSFLWNELAPYYAFDKIGSETLMTYFLDLLKGQNVFARDVKEAKLFAAETRAKYGYSKWELDKMYDFKLRDGRTFSTTLRHLLSVYAYSKRDQAIAHMSDGGFFHNDKETFRKEKGVIKMRRTDAEGYKVDAEVLAEIKETLGKEKTDYVDEMLEYLTKMGEKGNEVTRILWGVDIFTEKVYFPLKSKDDFLKKSTETAQAVSLKNDGMTKESTPGANNPIVLEAFDDVWANHIERMSQYHGLVVPIDNLNKVLHYGTWAGTVSMSVSTMLEGKFTSAATDYLEQFINDLNGGAISKGVTNPFWGFFSKWKKTAVGASMSTVVQQPTAILRALSEIDAKYFVGKPNLAKLSEQVEEMQTYAPVAIIKEIGGFDAGGGKQAARWINSDTLTGIDKVGDTIDNISMKGAEIADKIGWAIIWEAVKRETQATTSFEVGSQEFLEKCGDRFTEVINKTQVYDSTLSRSGYMRSKNEGVKMLTSFMGEPTVSINMMYSAVINAMRGGKEAKLKAARTIGCVYASIILAEALASAIYALRDDDEDESYWEKYLQSLGGSFISDIVLAPVTSLPGVKDFISIFQGWDIERSDMAIFKDIKDAFDGLFSESKSTYRKIEDFAGAIAALFGVPLKNVLRTGREIYNAIDDIFDGIEPHNGGAAFGDEVRGDNRSKTDKVYYAVLSGDKERIAVCREWYDDNSDFKSAIRKGLRENDPRIKKAAEAVIAGDTSKRAKIAKEIQAEGHFNLADIQAAINAEVDALRKKKKKS